MPICNVQLIGIKLELLFRLNSLNESKIAVLLCSAAFIFCLSSSAARLVDFPARRIPMGGILHQMLQSLSRSTCASNINSSGLRRTLTFDHRVTSAELSAKAAQLNFQRGQRSCKRDEPGNGGREQRINPAEIHPLPLSSARGRLFSSVLDPRGGGEGSALKWGVSADFSIAGRQMALVVSARRVRQLPLVRCAICRCDGDNRPGAHGGGPGDQTPVPGAALPSQKPQAEASFSCINHIIF